MHDIVASAPADADRMDYMERDSRSIGVTYGLFDRNRVLKSLLCYKSSTTEADSYRLGIKQSGLQAIENLMQARYELFVQVYYHKTNRAISRMLDAISLSANESMDLFAGVDTISDLITRYVDLSDEQFFRILLGKTNHKSPLNVSEIASSIVNRQLWKRILDPTTPQEAVGILNSLKTEFSESKDAIQLDESKPKALKDIELGAALLFRNGSGVYEAGVKRPWRLESEIIEALEKADNASVRIYFESTDSALAKQIRERALALSFQRRGGEHATS